MTSQSHGDSFHELLTQLVDASSRLNVAGRIEARDTLLLALSQIESTQERLFRLSGSHLQLACLRLGVDIGLFQSLTEKQGTSTLDDLSESLKVEPDLLVRVLRLLVSIGFVRQYGKDRFGAEKSTRDLAGVALQSGIRLLFDIHDRMYQVLPDVLAKHDYKDIEDPKNGAFQHAFNTELSCYEYLAVHPALLHHMQTAMELSPSSEDWLSVLPVQEDIQTWNSSDQDRVLFVDIGGGMGHQCKRFRQRYATIMGRVVLEDMEAVIQRIEKPMPFGIETIVYDFGCPQPIIGAKFYYLRNVLHGMIDSECIALLKLVAAAMEHESRLVIDDVILPDEQASWEACQLDFIMMVSAAGRKRTCEQWHFLLNAAGMQIIDVATYSLRTRDSLIIAKSAT